MDIEKLSVSEMMNRDVKTVTSSTTLRTLIRMMRKTNQHIFPVVDKEKKLLGVVNYNDILNIFRPFSKSVSEIVRRMPFVENVDDEDFDLELSPEMGTLILVDDIINKNFITVKQTDTVQEARRLMRLHSLNTLLVVAEKKLVGAINLLDIFVYIFKEHEIIKK
jgi:CBS domain-containing protein